ncbi:MAG: NuoM family protein, partial [Pirellulales bacterium]
MEQLLWITILLPVLGACLVVALSPWGQRAVRQSALVTTVLTLACTTILLINYRSEPNSFASSSIDWLGTGTSLDIRLSIGLDGLSVWLFGLAALLVFSSVLVSWEAIADRPTGFYALLLLLETGMLGVFAARHLILFYVFFEFTLVPLFFLIGIWGSEDRRYAAIKFFIYTLAGSMLTFLGLLSIVLWNHAAHGELTFSIPDLTASLAGGAPPMPAPLQMWIFLALLAGFAIKVPLFPFHTWLPLAHVQAPTAGSVLLAGVLLKIGTYGFVRFSMAMLPDATVTCMPVLLGLSVVAILYGALVSLAQRDIKKLIAYSSVSHLGFCTLGLFTINRLGMQGGTLQMINHGLSTGGLFACVGMLYERYHTREIRQFGGLAGRTPVLAFFMLVFTLSSIGLPGLNGFVGEFLVLIGMFQRSFTAAPAEWSFLLRSLAVAAVLGVVLGAWYMLFLVQRIFFGRLKEPVHGDGGGDAVSDLSPREVLALAPLVVFIVWIGLMPEPFLRPMSVTLNPITERAQESFEQRWGRLPTRPLPRVAMDDGNRSRVGRYSMGKRRGQAHFSDLRFGR